MASTQMCFFIKSYKKLHGYWRVLDQTKANKQRTNWHNSIRKNKTKWTKKIVYMWVLIKFNSKEQNTTHLIHCSVYISLLSNWLLIAKRLKKSWWYMDKHKIMVPAPQGQDMKAWQRMWWALQHTRGQELTQDLQSVRRPQPREEQFHMYQSRLSRRMVSFLPSVL